MYVLCGSLRLMLRVFLDHSCWYTETMFLAEFRTWYFGLPGLPYIYIYTLVCVSLSIYLPTHPSFGDSLLPLCTEVIGGMPHLPSFLHGFSGPNSSCKAHVASILLLRHLSSSYVWYIDFPLRVPEVIFVCVCMSAHACVCLLLWVSVHLCLYAVCSFETMSFVGLDLTY